MKQLFPRGKRIHPTDKDLVFHTAFAALFPVFLLVVLLFHNLNEKLNSSFGPNARVNSI